MVFVASVEEHIRLFHLPYMHSLRRHGHAVHVATRLEAAGRRNIQDGIIWHDVCFARSPLSPANIKALFQLLRLLKRENYDLIHVHTPVAAFLGRFAAWWVGDCRVLYTVHGFHFYRGGPLLQWLLFYPAEKLARCWTDVILVMNREDLHQAERLGYVLGQSVFMVPGVGVDLGIFGSDATDPRSLSVADRNKALGGEGLLDDKSVVFTCVAELIPRKNIRFLLRGWAKAAALLPDSHLFVVGVGPEEALLKKQIMNLGIRHVHFLGYRCDVPDILAATDVFVLVSQQEGLPRGILEAMAAGLPVVASHIRGNVDLVEDGCNGLLVKSNDVDGLAAALHTLGQSSPLRQRMGAEGKKRVNAYSLTEAVRQLDEIYLRLLTTKETPPK